MKTDGASAAPFCGKPQSLVNRLIAGNNNCYICDDCVRMCMNIVGEYDEPGSCTRL